MLLEFQVLLQCVLAVILGAVFGWRSESAGNAAGKRTHALVCMASVLFIRLGQMTAPVGDAELVMLDPNRVLKAIVMGVAFLGAGCVLQRSSQGRKSGIISAAGLLMAAVIGIALAAHQYTLAVGITVFGFFTLHGVDKSKPPASHVSTSES